MPNYKVNDVETLRNHIAGTQLAVLFDHWMARRRDLGRLPAQSELDPADMKTALQNLLIIDYDGERADYHVRLAGSSVREMLKVEPTGKYIRDVCGPAFAGELLERYDAVRLSGRPHLMRLVTAVDTRRPYRFHRLLLPLGGDAMIGCGCVQTHVDHIDASLEEMASKRTSLSEYLVDLG
ncbi:MAG: PAS domain-containing protein [Rhodospirillaceae bacterium]|nr:PAS domain-containing protein [Rhodospirillaceae bacterium]